MSTQFPETGQALRDLQAVADLGVQHPDLLEALSRLIDEGTPILQIDRPPATGAGDNVARYKLADELGMILAAVRARKVDANIVESSAGHDVAPGLVDGWSSTLDPMAKS